MQQGLDTVAREACACAVSVEGWTHQEELRFLFVAAALPTVQGEVLEIGSFKGRSTVALAKGANWAGQRSVVACDPFTGVSPGNTPTNVSTYEAFEVALERSGVRGNVEVHRELSTGLARHWGRPIRLLWIDGDHENLSARADLECFRAHLVPGAIVAFHDVCRRQFPGPTLGFMEDVVLSDAFGMGGLCRSIGWAQFVGRGGSVAHRGRKMRMYRLLAAWRLGVALGAKLTGITRWRYRRLRNPRSFEDWVLSLRGTRVGIE